MIGVTIKEFKDAFTGELLVNGDWIVANVETTMAWPVEKQKFRFMDLDIWVIPLTLDHYPALAIKRPNNFSKAKCEKILLHFLSAVCWVEGVGALVDGIGGGNLPRPMGRVKQFGYSIRKEFELEYLPELQDARLRLALAIMREGRGSNIPSHAFVSYYRVMELTVASKRDDWINSHLSKLSGFHAATLKKLSERTENIGAYLRNEGRNASAHGGEEPLIDPDDPSHARRLWEELPVMEALAELAIEEELGVETSHTNWQRHLYELAGFKALLGREIVEALVLGKDISGERSVEVPCISVEISGHPPYETFKRLHPRPMERVGPHQIQFALRTEAGDFGFNFLLDFKEERLTFDVSSMIQAVDDGSATAAEGMADIGRFMRDYYMNGKLIIKNAETGHLIARKDAFLPVNAIVNPDGFNATIERYVAMAKDRKSKAEK
jgi:hypothetical protein